MGDGSIREISPHKSMFTDSYITVGAEAVADIMSGQDSPLLWHVANKELKKLKAPDWWYLQNHLIGFTSPNIRDGLRVVYRAGVLRFSLVGDLEREDIGPVRMLVTKGRDPFFVIRFFSLDYPTLFRQPIDIKIGVPPSDFWLYATRPLFANMTLEKQ